MKSWLKEAAVPRTAATLRCVLCLGLSLYGVAPLGCSSDSSSPGQPAAADAGCAAGGTGVVMGPADTHCDADGGRVVQVVSAAACGSSGVTSPSFMNGTPATDGGDNGMCGDTDYGPALYGTAGSDDDCKYDVTWKALGPICAGSPVTIEVTAAVRATGEPLTGDSPLILATYNCSVPAYSDAPKESPPGTYDIGPLVFPQSGRWAMRFHFSERCDDTSPDSPHGHAAFWVDVP